MLQAVSKTFFHLLAQSGTLQRLASRVGMRQPTSFARRFIAGETIADAIAAARAVEARGLLITLDHLGENITTLAEAEAATREYLAMIAAIVEAGIGRNISLKLTQIGLDVDRARAVDNLRTILDHGAPAGFFLRLDMESSRYTDVTLDIFETLWHAGAAAAGRRASGRAPPQRAGSPPRPRPRRTRPAGQGRLHRTAAAAHGLQDAMKERFMRAYLTEGEPIGDPAALERLAIEAGLPADEVRDLLAGDRFAAEVREDERTANGFGIHAVPFFVVDRAIGASGAQPPEVLGELLQRGWEASRPKVQVVADGEACGPDGC